MNTQVGIQQKKPYRYEKGFYGKITRMSSLTLGHYDLKAGFYGDAGNTYKEQTVKKY